jgi:putative ABC transport system substrate-binding protein
MALCCSHRTIRSSHIEKQFFKWQCSTAYLSYGSNFIEQYRGAAIYVDRILRGAKVSELAVQFPTKFELVINLKTAKAIGLAIPEPVLLRADELIE